MPGKKRVAKTRVDEQEPDVRRQPKVNEPESAVAKPQERKFLGFSFTGGKERKRKIAPKAIGRFKERIREITHKSRGRSMEQVMEELAPYVRGWRGVDARRRRKSPVPAVARGA